MALSRINNALTRLLDIQVPVVCAPMAKVSNPELVAQATLGGGYAFLAAGYLSAQSLQSQVSSVRSILKVAGHLQDPARLPIGIAYFGWELEEDDKRASEMLNIALENGVQSIWLSFGNHLGRFVDYIRQADQQSQDKERTKIFVLVSTLEEALTAGNEWNADVIVAQGIEAGGHGSGHAPSVFSLVSSILSAMPVDRRPPIVAAGGLSNGAQVASLLTLGASGAVFGTRFLLTPESPYTDAQKAALLAADAASSVRTMAFDQARNTLSWPSGIDGRGLRNKLVEDFESGLDVTLLRERFAAHAKRGETNYMVTWGGAGVGEMHEVKGAKDIVHQLHRETIHQLQETQLFVSDARPNVQRPL